MGDLTEGEVTERARSVLAAAADREVTVRRNAVIFDCLAMCTWSAMRLYELESCITATRVCFEILRKYSIRVRAVPTQVRVFNAPMYARMQRGEKAADVDEVKRWHREDGSWNVGIGGFGYHQEGRWDGHMVALADGTIMLDPSLPQINRPEHGIVLAGTVGRVPDGWPEGSPDPLQAEEGGCLVVYEPIANDDRRWVATPSWRDAELREPVVAFLAAALDSALADL